MSTDPDGQGLGSEAAAAAFFTHRGFNRFYIFGFRIAGDTQAAAGGTGALFAVKRKKPRVQLFQTDSAGRADAGKAENFFFSAVVQ